MTRLVLICAVAVLATACSSKPKEQEAAQIIQVDPSTLLPAVDVVPKSALGAQELLSKECGLFLWSKTDPTQFIFFEKAQAGTARMQIADSAVDVTQTANRGDIFGQFLTEQGFAAPGGERIEVVIVPGEELQGGQRVESGRITITGTDNWQTIIPVRGVQACQP